MKLSQMFEDDKGKVSNLRVNSSLCIWFALLLAGYTTVTEKDINLEIFWALLVAGFAPKLIQKVAENKIGKRK